MLQASPGRLRSFAKSANGNVAILFAFALIPILIAVGAAVDYGRALIVRERMADAADAAALAIGSWPNQTQDQLKVKAQQFFTANYPPSTLGTVGTLNVTFAGDDIKVNVVGSVNTTFMKLASINTLDVGAASTVNKKQRNIELVLVLDTTGSMGSGGKLAALKSAAKEMVSTLFNGQATSTTLKVGVVPFAAAVNLGPDRVDSNPEWFDLNTYTSANNTADPIAFEDVDKTTGISTMNLYNPSKTGLKNETWAGCVRERGGSYELTDDAPSSGSPAKRWVPYLAPDEPDSSSSFTNNYLCDDPSKKNCKGTAYKSTTCVTSSSNSDDNMRQCYTAKYNGVSLSSTSTGPDFNCPPAPITAMTSTQSTVNDAIDALEAKGSTVIPTGLLWGWRLISPTAPFTEGAAYDDEKWVKAIVLLTDGQNDVNQASNGFDNSSYNAFGYAKNGHLGNTSGSNANATLDSKTLAVCAAIKAASTPDKRIQLYTIGFQVSSASKTLLTNCATKPDMFYDSPSNDQLAGIFQDIAQGLGELRIAQ